MPKTLADLLAEHRDAVAHFASRAAAIPADRWLVPRAAGKWTPAEETRHIILTYEACVADLRDGRQMAARTRGLQRLLSRAVGLTSILYRRRIPRPVRAPREVRPAEERGSQDELLAALATAVSEFERVYAETWQMRPGRTLAHPFFGAISLRQCMAVAVVHTRHHAAFLPASGSV
jgi:hypothetical protein